MVFNEVLYDLIGTILNDYMMFNMVKFYMI